MSRIKYGGFTLIELMITVVVLAIIAGLAYPVYTDYVMRARRSDAQITLLQIAAMQEKFFTECSSYAANFGGLNCAGSALGRPDGNSPDGHYVVTIDTANTINGACAPGQCFLLVATPRAGSPQVQDTDCGDFRLDSTGVRDVTGPDPGNKCWRR